MRVFSLKQCWSKNAPVSVGASIEVSGEFLEVDFAVRESRNCFCLSKKRDGEAVWEDSCVEVFLSMLGPGYANFEFNSKGVCYAARGKSRENRTELSESEYSQIIRNASGITEEGDFYRWNLSVRIPGVLFGLVKGKSLQNFDMEGNLYKCADLATEPHYLSAFPVNTPEPDFHKPEFFLPLFLSVDE